MAITYFNACATLSSKSILLVNYYEVYDVITENFAKILDVWELVRIFNIVDLDTSKSEGSSIETRIAVLMNWKIGSK